MYSVYSKVHLSKGQPVELKLNFQRHFFLWYELQFLHNTLVQLHVDLLLGFVFNDGLKDNPLWFSAI
jgi:hypothetical protein